MGPWRFPEQGSDMAAVPDDMIVLVFYPRRDAVELGGTINIRYDERGSLTLRARRASISRREVAKHILQRQCCQFD
jgi:hypothetical protein